MAYSPQPGIGVRDVYYAVLTESSDVVGGTPSWGTPVALPNVTRIGINPNGSMSTMRADDGPKFSANSMGNIDVTMDLADINPADRAVLLGHAYATGITTKAVTDSSPYVAIGFKRTLSGGIDHYFWLFKGKFSVPALDANTKADTIEFAAIPMVGQFVAMQCDNTWGNDIRTDDANAVSATLTGFFNQVTRASADVTALTATIAVGTAGDSGKVVCTFSKGSGASFSITSTWAAAPYANVADSTSARAGTWAVSGAGTSVTFKFTPSVAFAGGADIGVLLQGIKDNSGVTVTTVGKVLTF